ncbi:MAG: hypothetical protein Q9159_006877 [Coniocarpon cinnabarinum]
MLSVLFCIVSFTSSVLAYPAINYSSPLTVSTRWWPCSYAPSVFSSFFCGTDSAPKFPQIHQYSTAIVAAPEPQSKTPPGCTVRPLFHSFSTSHRVAGGGQVDIVYHAQMCSTGLVKGLIGKMDSLDGGSSLSREIVTIIVGEDSRTGEDVTMTCPRQVDTFGDQPQSCYQAVRPATTGARNMILAADLKDGRAGAKDSGDPEIGVSGFDWTVQTFGLDATSPIPIGSPIFFLEGGQPLSVQGATGFVSFYVNFTDDASDPGLGQLSPTASLSSSLSTSTQPSSTSSSITSTTSSSSSTSSASPTPITTQTTPNIPASTSNTNTTAAVSPAEPSKHRGLSTGAIAGIAVGCGLGIPLIGLLAWLHKRHYVRLPTAKATQAVEASPATTIQAKAVEADGYPFARRPGQDDGHKIELPG